MSNKTKIDWSIEGKLSFNELKRQVKKCKREEELSEMEIIFNPLILIRQLKQQDLMHIEMNKEFPLRYKVKFLTPEELWKTDGRKDPSPGDPLLPRPIPIEVNNQMKSIVLDWMKNRGFSRAEYYWAHDSKNYISIHIAVLAVENNDVQELIDETEKVTFY